MRPSEIELKPRLLSIAHAARYISVSRAQFYKAWLPKVRTIHDGSRHLVDRESLDRLIDEMLDRTQPGHRPPPS